MSAEENLGGEEPNEEKPTEKKETQEDMDVSEDKAEDKGVDKDKNNEEEKGICITRRHVLAVTVLQSKVFKHTSCQSQISMLNLKVPDVLSS